MPMRKSEQASRSRRCWSRRRRWHALTGKRSLLSMRLFAGVNAPRFSQRAIARPAG
jgi:hypothetical protein